MKQTFIGLRFLKDWKNLLTPSTLSQEIADLTAENQRGVNAVYEAEQALTRADYDLDLVEQKAFLGASGTVADRNAWSKMKSAEARLERDLKRAEYNRVKLKLKAIETALMAAGTQAKLMAVDKNN